MSLKNKRVAIIGSSIAGSALALLLSKHMQVKVFEQKSASKIHKKVCANVVTSSFLHLAKELGMNAKKIVKKRFFNAEFYSQNNSVKFPVQDCEIDRKELLQEMIKKAGRNGAEFFFNTKFADLEKTINGYNMLLENKGKKIIETADFIIGADGALTRVAEKSRLWQKRRFWLAVQAKVPKIKRIIAQRSYEIFFIKKFGYYSYIFPSGKFFVIGAVAKPQDAREKFRQFLDFLNIKKCNIEAALIPFPRVLRTRKGNVFLAGDSACQVKFTGGGIVPSLESAFALRDFIVYGNNKGINALSREIKMHQMIAKVFEGLSDSDFNILFEIAKDSSAIMAAKSRDELRKWAIKFVLQHPSLLRFLPKLF